MKFLSQSEQNLQERLVKGPKILEHRALFECEVMAKHILDEGKTISESLLEELKELREAVELGQENQVDFKRTAGIHARLSEIIKPAKPGTLAHLHEERESKSWLRFLGPVPFFRTMMLVSIVFLLSLIGLSVSEHINVVDINKGIFEHDGLSLLVNLLFLVTAAGLGAVFAALYEANQTLRNRTFDPELAPAYWARLAMGLVAGIILAELVPIRPPEGGLPGMGSEMSIDSSMTGELDMGEQLASFDLTRGDSTVPIPIDSTVPVVVPPIRRGSSDLQSDSAGQGRDSLRSRGDPAGAAAAAADSLVQDSVLTEEAIGEASRGGVMKVIVAVLGGFSANLLFNILIKMGKALENVVGSGDDIMGRIQQLDKRIMEQSQAENNAAAPTSPVAPAPTPPPPEVTPAIVAPPPPGKLHISRSQLKQMMPNAKEKRLAKFLDPLNRALERYEITTPLRIAHFIAQVGHESGSFRYTEELWPNPQLDAQGVAANGNRWQKRYEGRKDLGNTEVGDGYRFRGRGLIQLTGRANYKRYEEYLRSSGYPLPASLTVQPDLVAEPELAADSAAWFWRYGRGPNLNQIADADDVVKLTKRINGGTNGLADREARLSRAKAALGIS